MFFAVISICVSRSYPGFCSFGVGKLCEACFPTVFRPTVCLSKRMQKKKCPLTPRGVADISVCDIGMPCFIFPCFLCALRIPQVRALRNGRDRNVHRAG